MRAPFVDALPDWFRSRMPAPPRLRSALLTAVPAVVLGSVTHVLWDEFTHEGRWGEQHVPWLATRYFGIGGVHWARAASSLLGLVVVLVTTARTLQRAEAEPRPVRVRRFGSLSAGAIVLAGVTAAAVATVRATGGLHGAAFDAVTVGLPAAAAAGLAAAIAWWSVRLRAED